MEREGKGGERGWKKQEFMGEKLKQGILVGKRGGHSTPSPKWRVNFAHEDGEDKKQHFLTLPTTKTVSARKLAANLWEILPLANMNKGGGSRHHHQHHKEMGFEVPTHMDGPPHNPPQQQASTSSLRRQVAASMIQHHQLIERNGHVLQPVSPASYSSSLEVAPYNPAVTPTSSLDYKGGNGESSYNLKTSTELLKVLNRIWNLEEQHASNISLVKAAKRERDNFRAQIKKLLLEKQTDRQEMNELMKQVVGEKFVRKNKEQDRIKAAVQSLRDELENERKLRKHSESLHRKLAKELADVKYSFSGSLKEREKERKAQSLLEDLCDEFAKGIRDYEHEVRSMRHKLDKDHIGRENPDRLVLHISESWLDERMQLKLAEARNDLGERSTIVEKLSFEIETFLQARRSVGLRKHGNFSQSELKESCSRQHSLESFPLNEAVSAPQNAADEEESIDNDSHCFELNKRAGGQQSNGNSKQHGDNDSKGVVIEEMVKPNPVKKRVGLGLSIKGRKQPSLQVQFKEHMVRAMSCNGNKTQFADAEKEGSEGENFAAINKSQKFEMPEVTTREDLPERNNERVGSHGPKSFLSLEGEKIHPEHNSREDSCGQSVFTGHASPVQQCKLTSSPEPKVSESSLKVPQGLKENTLKSKLLEARLEARRNSHSKASRNSL